MSWLLILNSLLFVATLTEYLICMKYVNNAYNYKNEWFNVLLSLVFTPFYSCFFMNKFSWTQIKTYLGPEKRHVLKYPIGTGILYTVETVLVFYALAMIGDLLDQFNGLLPGDFHSLIAHSELEDALGIGQGDIGEQLTVHRFDHLKFACLGGLGLFLALDDGNGAHLVIGNGFFGARDERLVDVRLGSRARSNGERVPRTRGRVGVACLVVLVLRLLARFVSLGSTK